MILKKYFFLLLFLFLSTFSSISAYDSNEIETFYYTHVIETISKYIDEQNTTLGYLYHYQNFLEGKMESEFDKNILSVLSQLSQINQKNIQNQLIQLDTNPNNIQIFLSYFKGKNPAYEPFLSEIELKQNINVTDQNGNTILLPLLQVGSFVDIDFALNRGISPNVIDHFKNVTVYEILKLGGIMFRKEYPDKILAGKIDENGTIEILQNLILKGFNVNLVDKDSKNIFFYIVDLGNQAITEAILKEKKLNLTIKNNTGDNGVFYAIKQQKFLSLLPKMLELPRNDINAVDKEGNNLIQVGSSQDDTFFKTLFVKNISLNHQNNLGETEVMTIISKSLTEDEAIKKYTLLKQYKPIKPEIGDKEGNNTLYYASTKGYKNLFNILIKDGVSIKNINKSGKNLAMSYLEKKNGTGSELLSLILTKMTSLNQQDHSGSTVWHFAMKEKSIEVIDYLLKSGANPYILNNDEINILTEIIKQNDVGLFQKIISHSSGIGGVYGKEKINIFIDAVEQNRNDMVKTMLKLSKKLALNINFSDKNGNNALFYAIKNNNFELSTLLIHYGIQTEKQNESGDTPLIIASQENNYNIIPLLLSQKVDIYKKNNLGKTALHYACKNKNDNIIFLLTASSPQDLSILKDAEGKNCFDYLHE